MWSRLETRGVPTVVVCGVLGELAKQPTWIGRWLGFRWFDVGKVPNNLESSDVFNMFLSQIFKDPWIENKKHNTIIIFLSKSRLFHMFCQKLSPNPMHLWNDALKCWFSICNRLFEGRPFRYFWTTKTVYTVPVCYSNILKHHSFDIKAQKCQVIRRQHFQTSSYPNL